MKPAFRTLVRLFSLAVSFVSGSAPVGAEPIDQPDIHTQTLQEYAFSGDCNAEMKIRMSIYLDSLGSELDSLYQDIEEELTAVPDLQDRFRDAHSAFLQYGEIWSAFAEDIQWFDLNTGESWFGTGYGYTYVWNLAALYWERIILYRAFADGGLSDGFGEFTVPSDRIGGH